MWSGKYLNHLLLLRPIATRVLYLFDHVSCVHGWWFAVVPLPSLHHRWSLDNSTVADIDPSKGLITAQTYGTTMVVVEDLRVAGHQQTSMLHVVKPISLVLYLSPLPTRPITSSVRKDTPVMSSDSPWQVVLGHKYVVQILAFSWESGTQPLLLTKVLSVLFPSCLLFPRWPLVWPKFGIWYFASKSNGH